MARATIAIELKNSTTVELRLSGKGVEPKTQRFDFDTAEEANAAMTRATEWAVAFAKTAKIPHSTSTSLLASEGYGKGEGFLL